MLEPLKSLEYLVDSSMAKSFFPPSFFLVYLLLVFGPIQNDSILYLQFNIDRYMDISISNT